MEVEDRHNIDQLRRRTRNGKVKKVKQEENLSLSFMINFVLIFFYKSLNNGLLEQSQALKS